MEESTKLCRSISCTMRDLVRHCMLQSSQLQVFVRVQQSCQGASFCKIMHATIFPIAKGRHKKRIFYGQADDFATEQQQTVRENWGF